LPGKRRVDSWPLRSSLYFCPKAADRLGFLELNCSLLLIYLPRKDKRLSRPGWLTCSERFTHIMVTRQLEVKRRTGKFRVSGLFVPLHFRSRERKVHRKNFRSSPVEHSFHGTFVPWNIRSMEHSLQESEKSKKINAFKQYYIW